MLNSFCALFPDWTEWQTYNHYQTLRKYHASGAGNPTGLGPIQGAGWVAELLARLTDSLDSIKSLTGSSVNRTLDNDDDHGGTGEKTFPLGREIYMDFTHDNLITSVVFALGLFGKIDDGDEQQQTTNSDSGSGHGGMDTYPFETSTAVPFAARLIVEKMTCQATNEAEVDDASTKLPTVSDSKSNPNLSSDPVAISKRSNTSDTTTSSSSSTNPNAKAKSRQKQADEYIRIILNDRVMPLPEVIPQCALPSSSILSSPSSPSSPPNSKANAADPWGRCPLTAFVTDRQEYVNRAAGPGGEWDRCYEV